MRVLLEECVPRRLRDELPGHDVPTVPEMGWASQENGALLVLATGKFEVFITTDQRLSYQQAVSKLSIGVIVLIAKRNKPRFLQQLVPALRRALTDARPGEVRRLGV